MADATTQTQSLSLYVFEGERTVYDNNNQTFHIIVVASSGEEARSKAKATWLARQIGDESHYTDTWGRIDHNKWSDTDHFRSIDEHFAAWEPTVHALDEVVLVNVVLRGW